MDYQTARQQFAARLRTLRTVKGITQEQLAELMGKTTEHISFLERGERAPSFEVIVDLARTLGVSVADVMNIDVPGLGTSLIEALAVEPITDALPEPAQEKGSTKKQQSDIERLNTAFHGIYEAQKLADEYGINDILQDNGGKVLQLLILLGLRGSPGREGNDAVDTMGNEYELKTVNRALNKNAGITTHHHLNRDILTKYRAVKAWYIAIYDGVHLREIYKVSSAILEPLFQEWERKLERAESLNNPKIPMAYVRQGERVYPVEVST